MQDKIIYDYITSESVCEGHPDKICDLIADSILDEALKNDKNSRVACEVCCTTGMVMVMGEFTTKKYIDIPLVVRNVVKEIGYNDPALGFDYHTCAVLTYINQQSEDIALGVDGKDTGAGDQGMMFGYACNDTKELMPLPIMLAHAITKRLSEVRKNGEMPYLRPDGKAQVTIAYKNGVISHIDTIVVSCQHAPNVSNDILRQDVVEKVVKKVVDQKLLCKDTKYYINPTGRFVKGGPHGDSGLTGRKIIVDTYGGVAPHGGGSFSGKDPTKVDRSAAYYARYAAKNVVAAGLADRCLIKIAYAIGRPEPVSVCVDTFSTGKFNDNVIGEAVKRVFDFRPTAIIKQLDLKTPIYACTTNYGHFGKSNLAWERIDKADALRKEAEAQQA